MSEVKVNKISPRTNCGTVQLGDSGDTITIPAGATITNNGTQTGFGRTGAVDWDTTAKTASFTGVSGNGYFINSASSAITVTLPASPSAGDIVGVADYNNTAETNPITIARNGSNINGSAANVTISFNKAAVVLVYVDATSGWANVSTASPDDITNPFIVATGGTITCSGDFKIHTFTSPGTFTVTNAGTPSGSTIVSYTVVGAGGGGGSGTGSSRSAAGGGAGGFREGRAAGDTFSVSPLNAPAGLPVSAQAYPITVSGGGAGGTSPGNKGTSGGTSVFSTITSAGGGGGGGRSGGCSQVGANGGSGGGGVDNAGAGTGNTPPVSPPQGNNGGNPGGAPNCTSGSGGGAGAAGVGGGGPQTPGVAGGAGVTNCITASPVARAGGGGSGGSGDTASSTGGAGGSGGGGNGGPRGTIGGNGSDNTGGGGGGSGANPGKAGGNGGSGVVIIRYKYQ